jgi:hypothetical protein
MNTATEHTLSSTLPIHIHTHTHTHTHIQDVHPRTQRYATTCEPRGAQEPVSHSCSWITRVKRALMLRSPAGNDADEFRASLSASSDKKVPRNKPDVKPPLSGVSMNKLYVPSSFLILYVHTTDDQPDLHGPWSRSPCRFLHLAIHRLGSSGRWLLEPP